MPSALITGITGFTGKHLASELKKSGYDVYGTCFHKALHENNNFVVDLRDLEALRKIVAKIQPDFVVNLAGMSFPNHHNVSDFYQTNVVGTRNLLQALAESKKVPKNILLASSANVYGYTNIDPITEITPFNPANDYAVSKVAMEFIARQWMNKLPIIIVRTFNYSGIGQMRNFLIPKIIDHFQDGLEDIELGNIEVARDFSDVRNVVYCYRKLIELAPSSEVFNICSGNVYSLKQILSIMSDIAGYRINVRINPEIIRKNEVPVYRGSNTKLIETIGTFDLIPLNQTLRWMFEGAM